MIPANSDLYDYITPGSYVVPTANATTLKNKPWSGNQGAYITVIQYSSSTYIGMEARVFGGNVYYMDYAGTWGKWKTILTNADIIYANSLAGLVSKMSNLQAYRTYTLFADGVLGNELTGVTASCTGVISKLSGTMYDVMISHSAGAYIYTIRIQNGAVLDRRRIATTQVTL